MLSVPPHQQKEDCSITWDTNAEPSEWKSLRLSGWSWESRSQCDEDLVKMQKRWDRGLERHLEYIHKRHEAYWKAIPWWKRPLAWIVLSFWAGTHPERDERCSAIRDAEMMHHARCVPQTESRRDTESKGGDVSRLGWPAAAVIAETRDFQTLPQRGGI